MENNKYQQGKIYKIVCNITNEIYIGSTTEELKRRLAKHKQPKRSQISRQIIERGNYKIELIKDYPCNSRWELEEEERKYILENKCINKSIPHRTIQEINNQKKLDKITCECGATVRRDSIYQHRKTMKHIKLMECIILD
jgi:hypothetical protein